MTLDQIEIALRHLSDIDEDSLEIRDRLGCFVLESIANFAIDGLEPPEIKAEIIQTTRDELASSAIEWTSEEFIMAEVQNLLDTAFP